MNPAYADLIPLLRERLRLVADEASRRDVEQHLARLRAISERLEQAEAQLPAQIDPQLRHFLRQRSYNKALDFLEALPAHS